MKLPCMNDFHCEKRMWWASRVVLEAEVFKCLVKRRRDVCFIQKSCKSLALELFFSLPHHEPRTFKSYIYTVRLICTRSVAQALSMTAFRFRKDVELTKLFKIAYRVVFRGRRPDFRDFKSRSKIACNFTKTKHSENPKVGSDSP
jgi:hypothetical protein